MTAVLDTSSLSVLKSYYPTTFPSLWARFDGLVEDGSILSVREVFNELENDNRITFVLDWAKQHKPIFSTPSDAELLAVAKILAIPHFQSVISTKALLKGTPVADPFVVARAMVEECSVITEEALKPSAAKIPNICEHFDVPCHNLEWFMQQHNLSF